MVALDQIRNFDLGFQNIQKKIHFLLPQNYKFFHKSTYISVILINLFSKNPTLEFSDASAYFILISTRFVGTS